MKRPSILLAGAALFAMSAGSAIADCADELARLSPGSTTGSVSGGVSKDGSLAPLQSGPSASGMAAGAGTSGGPSASGTGQGIAKDGSTMPLANQPGGGSAGVATSKEDAQAQQRGGQTAAAEAGQGSSQAASGSHSSQMMAALQKARSLHQQGNEAGCMQAIDEAKRLR